MMEGGGRDFSIYICISLSQRYCTLRCQQDQLHCCYYLYHYFCYYCCCCNLLCPSSPCHHQLHRGGEEENNYFNNNLCLTILCVQASSVPSCWVRVNRLQIFFRTHSVLSLSGSATALKKVRNIAFLFLLITFSFFLLFFCSALFCSSLLFCSLLPLRFAFFLRPSPIMIER